MRMGGVLLARGSCRKTSATMRYKQRSTRTNCSDCRMNERHSTPNNTSSCRAKSVTLESGVGSPRKLVLAIQEVEFLSGQRLATSPVAKPVGRRRRRSEARSSKSVGCVIEPRKLFERRGPVREKHRRAACSWRANADGFNVPERSTCHGVMASRVRDHRGRRAGHADTRIARELGRASSFPV